METRELREMMTDPATVSCRIFVGSLPSDQMTCKDLEQLFAQYGKIEGALLNRGFGFVQFETEDGARAAVKGNGKIFHQGRKLDIKAARPIKRPDERERSPISDKGREPTRFPVRNKFQPNVLANTHSKIPTRTNDCEIIVVNKAQTEYAEYIEEKLRSVGLKVDLLFPNEDVKVTRVLSNIANRGCKFAVVITAQNEEHRSITLNILHGPPQEHRNMPLEDAVALVSQKFEEFAVPTTPIRPTEVVIPTAVPTIVEMHPPRMQTLINLFADNRTLTVLQIDQLLGYLQKKRETQLRIELGDSAASVQSLTTSLPAPIMDVQQTLQSRILNILNKSNSPVAQSVSSPVAALESVTKNALSDSSIHQTLKSIMQGNLLRKFSD